MIAVVSAVAEPGTWVVLAIGAENNQLLARKAVRWIKGRTGRLEPELVELFQLVEESP